MVCNTIIFPLLYNRPGCRTPPAPRHRPGRQGHCSPAPALAGSAGVACVVGTAAEHLVGDHDEVCALSANWSSPENSRSRIFSCPGGVVELVGVRLPRSSNSAVPGQADGCFPDAGDTPRSQTALPPAFCGAFPPGRHTRHPTPAWWRCNSAAERGFSTRLSAYPLLPLAAPPNTSVSIAGYTA